MTAPVHSDGIGIVQTDIGTYHLRRLAATGSISLVYQGEAHSGKCVMVKVCCKRSDNRLMLNEQHILARISDPCLPVIIDRFETEDGRVATVFESIEGLNLLEFRSTEKHRGGLANHFHIGWFLEKQLGLLGKLHKEMIVHGDVQPQHLLITPSRHKVHLIDFCFAWCQPSETDRIAAWAEHYSAPEIKHGASAHPGMDIYSLGKCAVYLLGGNPASGTIPTAVGLDSRIRSFIDQMIEPNHLKRPHDAWGLARTMLTLRRKVYGPARWVTLEM